MAWVSERHRMQMVGCLCLLLLGWRAAWSEQGGVEEGEVRRGAFEAVFGERCPESNVENIFKRMGQKTQPRPSFGNDYRIGDESYSVYVPPDYAGDTAYGLLVWVGAGDRGDVPQDFAALMDEHNLIWVGAHRSGNRHNVPGRRMALALDGVHNMKRQYNVDPNRIYVSGLSGGGRVASILAMHYPDIFAGGIFVVGVECWEAIAVTGQPGRVYKPMPIPRPQYLAMARERGRYVLLTGDHDSNRRQTKDYYEYGYKKKLRHVLYIQVPGMGHAMPPPDWYEKAIVFLDTAMAKAGKRTRGGPSRTSSR